jgi:hypothetical protein
MKIRIGFVSNSSTTSFTCDVCGYSESHHDSVGIEEFGMMECENGHIICQKEMLEEWRKTEEDEEEDIFACPERCCPICKFTLFSTNDLAAYLLKKHGITREEVFAQVKMENKRRKKLRNSEYNMYVCIKLGLDREAILEEVKSIFATYKDFKTAIKG